MQANVSDGRRKQGLSISMVRQHPADPTIYIDCNFMGISISLVQAHPNHIFKFFKCGFNKLQPSKSHYIHNAIQKKRPWLYPYTIHFPYDIHWHPIISHIQLKCIKMLRYTMSPTYILVLLLFQGFFPHNRPEAIQETQDERQTKLFSQQGRDWLPRICHLGTQAFETGHSGVNCSKRCSVQHPKLGWLHPTFHWLNSVILRLQDQFPYI